MSQTESGFKLMIELVIMKIDFSEVNHLFAGQRKVARLLAGYFKPG